MISNLFNKNIMKILALFFISPGNKYPRKEIKEKTKMNNIPLDNNLNKLLNLKILKQEKGYLKLNFDYEFKEIIEIARKEFVEFNLPLNVYYIILDIVEKISGLKNIKEVYLFGSYAKLIYRENSDIDIAVVFSNKIKNRKNLEKRIDKTIEKINRKYKKKAEIHFFLEKDMKEKDPVIKDILRNGKKVI